MSDGITQMELAKMPFTISWGGYHYKDNITKGGVAAETVVWFAMCWAQQSTLPQPPHTFTAVPDKNTGRKMRNIHDC